MRNDNNSENNNSENNNSENNNSENNNSKINNSNKKKGSIFTTIIGLIGLALIIFASYKIVTQLFDYKQSNDLYEKIENEFVSKDKKTVAPTTEAPEEYIWYELAEVDFNALKEENSDVIGWIMFETEDISYPILYSGDNDKYLRTALDGSYATAGSIFMEENNTPDFEDSHTIIYGHNMKNLSMFGKLKYYNRDEEYYKDHMYFQVFVEGKIYRYQIFAYETVLDDSFIYEVPYSPDDNFLYFVNKIKKISEKDTGVEVTKDDKIISLSTCSTSGDQYRFVVHGVRVDTYTKEKVNNEE